MTSGAAPVEAGLPESISVWIFWEARSLVLAGRAPGMSHPPWGPAAGRGTNQTPYQSGLGPSRTGQTGMGSSIPRPENLATPSRTGGSHPRTPDPRSMPLGAYQGMGFGQPMTNTPVGAGPNPMALVPMTPTAPVALNGPDYGFAAKFTKFFDMACRYAYAHMNFPSSAREAQLPQDIKNRLMKAATKETAFQLGSTGATRYFLMQKVILQWITKHVFKPSLFSQFDLEADHRIVALKDGIYQDTPPVVKYQLLSDISSEVQKMRHHPNFQPYYEKLVKDQANRLWQIVRPLMHQHTSMDWEDLEILVREAYVLGGDMAATPYEWHFEFAEVNCRYDVSMISKDPYMHGTAEELARMGYTVKLGVAPAVHLRDNSQGMVRTSLVSRHQVLLRS